jgi:FkbH-like protein
MTQLFTALSWLPRPPADFRQRCTALLDSGPDSDGTNRDVGRTIIQLATHALEDPQMRLLARTIATLRTRGVDLAPLTPFRLGIVGNGTLDLLLPALVASAARFGIALECITPHYGQILQPATDSDSALHRARPHAVLLALDYRALPWLLSPDGSETAAAQVSAAVDFVATIRRGIRSNSNVPCIVQSLAAPVESLFGSLDRAIPGTPRHMVDQFNQQLIASLPDSQDVLLDVAGLAETVGLAEWHSPMEWNLAKLPFASVFIPLYADHVGRILGALRGKSRRCLILDLDNTLWGGVIGDDGLEDIVIAQGDATGEAFLSVQRLAIELRSRGIVLAVCSKNDDAVARSGFTHPEMQLRVDHIAVFQANWDDKATNIKAIAKELSLGVDAMVFLDDNPVERGLVRQILPEVAVPELPDDPALYARTLAAAGYFEALIYSAEDRARANFYQDNARRAALQSQAGDVGAYLASLDMTITFQSFDVVGRARIAQLINKSNQFNLTTRRYTEIDVAGAEVDCFTLQIRLADRFGDNGMISCIICRDAGLATWEIDTWLMSCRVLGRGVEAMVLREIIAAARAQGITTLIGVYRPTSRNGMVSDHYSKLGFAADSTELDGTTRWRLTADKASAPAGVPMKVVRLGQIAMDREVQVEGERTA